MKVLLLGLNAYSDCHPGVEYGPRIWTSLLGSIPLKKRPGIVWVDLVFSKVSPVHCLKNVVRIIGPSDHFGIAALYIVVKPRWNVLRDIVAHVVIRMSGKQNSKKA